MSGLRIVGLNRRSSGGRAYKVIYPPNYLVDLRENVLLDIIYNAGINVGGKLNGEYVWSVNGSQMRLIRVGSADYKDITAFDEIRNAKRISIKDLKPGSIYIAKSGPPAIFLGFVSTVFMKPQWDYSTNNNRYSRHISGVESYKRKAMLWFKRYYGYSRNRYSLEKLVDSFHRFINDVRTPDGQKAYGRPSIETGHSMRKEIGTVDISEGIIYAIRNRARDETLETISRRRADHGQTQETNNINTLCSNSPLMNMVPYGEDPLESILPACERIIRL
jgi:hypothetical protein